MSNLNEPIENRVKTGPISEIDDEFTKNRQITKEEDLNVNKISTEEEIRNRKILKITGPKKCEEEESSKRLFVLNHVKKDESNNNPLNPPTLFTNPFHPKEGTLFKNNGGESVNKEVHEIKPNVLDDENKQKLFGEKPNVFCNNF